MDATIWTVIGTGVGIVAIIYTFLRNFKTDVLSRLDSDIRGLDSDIQGVGDKVDKLGRRLDGHAQRIDQLYTMFVDLLKDRKNTP